MYKVLLHTCECASIDLRRVRVGFVCQPPKSEKYSLRCPIWLTIAVKHVNVGYWAICMIPWWRNTCVVRNGDVFVESSCVFGLHQDADLEGMNLHHQLKQWWTVIELIPLYMTIAHCINSDNRILDAKKARYLECSWRLSYFERKSLSSRNHGT